MMKYSLFALSLLVSWVSLGQEEEKAPKPVKHTFSQSRVISLQSVECLGRNVIDYRICHRFGDLAGSNGGYHNFFGIDQSADIRIGVDYGILDNLEIGVGRSKGASPWREIYDGTVKWRFLQQTKEKGSPLSLALIGSVAVTSMSSSTQRSSALYFGKFAHRVRYHTSLLVARKFAPWFSAQIGLGYSHRNYVHYSDQNMLPTTSIALRFNPTEKFGILIEAGTPIWDDNAGYYGHPPSLGLGFEFVTFGHVFLINLTNTRGLTEHQLFTDTTSDLLQGQFRLGFTITRSFDL